MNVTEPFVLKQDVLLIPCAELSEDVRSHLSFEEGDFTLSLRHGRALAQVIDGETASLLALFREPRTIAQAILANSRSLAMDPEARLEEMLPHLGAFVQNRILVPAGSEEEREIRPQYEGGTVIAGWKIVRCASLMEDSEVYQLHNGDDVAALKIARLTTPRLKTLFENEIDILRHLERGGIAPRLIDAGQHEERPYAVMEWISGVDAGVAAAHRRHDRAALIDLSASVAAAYAELHGCGVLHGDVHPRNVVVAGDAVRLIDFGYSRFADRPPRSGRGGIAYFFEPECIAARRQGAGAQVSAAGEQYSVAALLYLLLTGRHYLEFRYEREEMEGQTETEPPLPFASRGVPPWPEVEQILFRALEKDPARRFASLSGMAAALAGARDIAVREALATPVSREAHALLDATLRALARGGAMFKSGYPAPKTSVSYGAAGAAVGLLRIAETRGDPALLALADVWRSRAVALIADESAYHDSEDEAGPNILYRVTPYHAESGVHAAAAMIAAAMGDTPSQRRAIKAFVRASDHPCPELDLALGRCGSLLAAAMLLGLSEDLPEAAALRAFGGETMRSIWEELDSHAPVPSASSMYTGMAHGWTGYVYAALRWCEASGDPFPSRLGERLHELAAAKIVRGRGAVWPATIAGMNVMSGWCNGTAGQVFLFTLAHRMLGDAKWLELAELSAWNNWDVPRGPASLCCGTAGRAYALLNFYKHTGERAWLSRARQLANDAASVAESTSLRKNALWRGELGVAVLIADLASPENARMPFFE